MELFVEILTLFASVSILGLASQIVVSSATKIAKITRLGEVVIGFILLSVATSIPEISVAISSVISGNVSITIGDLLGSNVTNICLIIALGVILVPKVLRIKRKELKTLSLVLFFASIIPLILLVLGGLSTYVGVVLILFFLFFCVYSVKKKITLKEIKSKKNKNNVHGPLVWLFFGLFFVISSAMFVVESVSNISNLTGIAKSAIGATIVALSTSIPEFSVCLTAIKEGHPHLTLGDTIGSCLTNLTLILGMVLTLSPFVINIAVFSTIIFFVIISASLLWFFIRDGELSRIEGVVLLFIYMFFILTTYGVITFIKLF